MPLPVWLRILSKLVSEDKTLIRKKYDCLSIFARSKKRKFFLKWLSATKFIITATIAAVCIHDLYEAIFWDLFPLKGY